MALLMEPFFFLSDTVFCSCHGFGWIQYDVHGAFLVLAIQLPVSFVSKEWTMHVQVDCVSIKLASMDNRMPDMRGQQ